MKFTAALLGLLLAVAPVGMAQTTPIPSSFQSTGADRAAIQALLDNYTKAVSSKNQALFESLLLNTSIPFSGAAQAVGAKGAVAGTQNYADFRKGVFQGEPFTQRFQDVDIRQDGPLAQVSLVFVNTDAGGSSWGWKTMQLLKVGGTWKIASEFYTGHG